MYSFEYDPAVPLSTTTNTFELKAATGNIVRLRLRLKPGVTRFEEAFSGFTYDQAALPPGSGLVFPGGAPAIPNASNMRVSTDITIGEDDVPSLKTIDMQRLFDPIKVPPFFYTVDSSI